MLTVSVCLEKETKKHRRWPIPNLQFNKMSFRDKLPSVRDRRIISEIIRLYLNLYAIREKPEVDLESLNCNNFKVRGRNLRTGQFTSVENVLERLARQYSEFN